MAKQDRATLKTYFETGDVPTQDQFEHLIDSAFHEKTNLIYVDKSGNDSTGTGTPENPFLRITEAISNSSAGDVIQVNPGEYTENITLTSGVHLIGHGATLIGSLAIGEGSSVYLFKHLSNANSQSMVTKSGSNVSYYRTVISDGRGDTGSRETVTNILNQTNDSILFVDIETLYVTTYGRGIRDFAASFGHIHFNIKDLYLAGSFCKGVDAAGGSSDLIGYIDHILKINSPSGTTGIEVASGSSVEVTMGELEADTAYSVNAAGTMYLNCGKITGTKTGVNKLKSSLADIDHTFTETVDLSNQVGKFYNQKVIDSALTFTEGGGTVDGGKAFYSLVADGTNTPDFSAFEQHAKSDSWVNTANAINDVEFFVWSDGTKYYKIVNTGRTYS